MMRETVRGHRRSIRLKGYDYSAAGVYFVTICTQDRACVFGTIADGVMQVNAVGQIVQDELARTPIIRPEMQIDASVVMPNHVHFVVHIVGAYGDTPNAGAYIDTPVRGPHGDTPNGRARGDDRAYIDTPVQAASGNPQAQGARAFRSPSRTIGAMVRGFKSATTTRINALRGTPGVPVWQRNYYEQIVRDDESLQRVQAYVQANPARWLADRDNPNPIHGVERRPND
jgi:REP element-mobilizing transposase RayT